MNLTGKETSAVLRRRLCKLSGRAISGMFAQGETADVDSALFVSQGQSQPRLLAHPSPAEGRWLPEGRVTERVGLAFPPSLPPRLSPSWQGEFSAQLISPAFRRAMGHIYVRKVTPALTGLAELRNLITVAGESRRKAMGRRQEMGDVRMNGKFPSNTKVCVCVCVI